jgi:flagellar biosynthesis/type III secretory pathway chaperone
MTTELNEIIVEEYKALKALFEALNEQFQYLAKRDVLRLSAITKKIEQINKDVARFEIERRKITKGEAMSKIVRELKDKELENNYRSVKRLLGEIRFQKDANEMLIRQGLGFTTQMLNFLNPDRGPKTYNSYGKRR